MKKSLLLILSVFTIVAKAQCPFTINGMPSGGTINMCSGDCPTISASSIATCTLLPTGQPLSPTFSFCPNSTATYTLLGTDSAGTCTDTNIFTINVSPTPTITTNSGGPICSGSAASLCAYGAQTYTWSPASGLSCATCACPMASLTSSIVYTVCGSNSNGCYSCTTLNLSVSPTPTVSFSLTNSAPQVWDANVNYAGGTGALTYAWNFGDGTTSTVAYPSHTYTAAGWYNVCVTVTDAYGCSANYCLNDSLYRTNSSMITLNVVNGTTGVTQAVRNNINFYPNPANDHLMINENVNFYEIYDISGKLLMSGKTIGKTNLNIATLSEGVYLIRMQSAGNWVSKKLLISR